MNLLLTKLKTFLKEKVQFVIKNPFKSALYGFLSIIFLLIFIFILTYLGAFGKIPKEAELKNLKNPITSTLYSSQKTVLATYFLQNRSNIDSTELNNYLVDALVATEDVRFYDHKGIDYKSYARVIIKSLLLQQGKGGGSTITQQIAKNIFGRKKQYAFSTLINKMREVIIARRLESVYTKNELLLLYFNTVSFGENLFGIEKASQRFFNRTPKKLSLAECATLVGVLKAPSFYNPRTQPERSENRRNVVLNQMVKYGYITEEEAEKQKKPLKLRYVPPAKISSIANYYKEFVKNEFNAWAEKNPTKEGHIYDLELDGLKIYTTINPSVQNYAENAMKRNMDRLQNLMDLYWTSATTQGGKEAFIKKLINNHPEVKALRAANKSEAEIQQFVSNKKLRKYWEIGEGYQNKMQSLQDSIISAINRLHTGILVMNSRNGAILGYLGGIDYGFSQYDQIQNKKQVGSTFKPITYLAGLESGIDPCDFFDNQPITYKKYDNWKPRNANGSYGGSYSMYGALANSVNTASVAIQLRAGTNRVVEQARKMGIEAKIPKVPSIVLGTADISLYEMVKAYASISNGGNQINPYIIDRIEDHNGVVLYKATPKYNGKVASYNSIKNLQKMMEFATTNGTGASIQNYQIPYNIIGKTGTTQNNGDGWFIGCSPEIVIGAWVGTLDKRVQFNSTRVGSGASTALPMVASIFKSMSSWRNPILTNFTYDFKYFPCPPFSEFSSEESNATFKNDSTYIRSLLLRDSILEVEKLRKLDSIQQLDSLNINKIIE
ncbi:transglycosylase domain-containing protein [Polaribacter sp.]|uniref:transglycosylase domain-containing protein n=1 Tax=Polaribacter sp. TaxID=1920175 RepID=UPI004047ACE4